MTFVEIYVTSIQLLGASEIPDFRVAIIQIFATTGRNFNEWMQFFRFSTIERANIKFIAQRSDNDGQEEESDWHLLIFKPELFEFQNAF